MLKTEVNTTVIHLVSVSMWVSIYIYIYIYGHVFISKCKWVCVGVIGIPVFISTVYLIVSVQNITFKCVCLCICVSCGDVSIVGSGGCHSSPAANQSESECQQERRRDKSASHPTTNRILEAAQRHWKNVPSNQPSSLQWSSTAAPPTNTEYQRDR